MSLLKKTAKYRLLATNKSIFDTEKTLPWLLPFSTVTVGASSWIAAIEWVPNGTLRSVVRINTGSKWYSFPSVHYSLFLEMLDSRNVPYNGIGSRMWELGMWGFSQKASDRYLERLKLQYGLGSDKKRAAPGVVGGGAGGIIGGAGAGVMDKSEAEKLLKKIQDGKSKIKQKGARIGKHAFEQLLLSLFTLGKFSRGLIGAAAIAKIFS